ncbi:MAG TPA: N-acetylmuramidase domain-containing protein [Myxococcaceae bacterium]|nr:N-acetylmuramidase domain-containing protein [Myxococcaceae bacterium]
MDFRVSGLSPFPDSARSAPRADPAKPRPPGFFKGTYGKEPLVPATPATTARPVPAEQAAVAETYNRIGGLLTTLAMGEGLDVRAMLAVWCVESAGKAFVPRQAIIRFENHLFFREWGRFHPDAFDAHFQCGGRAGVPGKAWENHRFREVDSMPFVTLHDPSRSFKLQQQGEYRALEVARTLAATAADPDATPALRSISIGGCQILLSHHAKLGYPTPKAMYQAFQANERAHVLGFFDFCEQCPGAPGLTLLGHLRKLDWSGFARGYNGPGQVPRYSELLQKLYARAEALFPHA